MRHLDTFIERLTFACDRKIELEAARGKARGRITQAEIASVAGVSRSAVTYWFQGTNGANSAQARKLAKFLEINSEWLEAGEGQILPTAEATGAGDAAEAALRELLGQANAISRIITVYQLADTNHRKVIDLAVDEVVESLELSTLLHKRQGWS